MTPPLHFSKLRFAIPPHKVSYLRGGMVSFSERDKNGGAG